MAQGSTCTKEALSGNRDKYGHRMETEYTIFASSQEVY